VSSVRTLSDTKRAFYHAHTRPISSIYRRVVEELMVEMHLLSVNADFRYDDIYALGVVTSFDRFMQGYRPERDKESIFNAICQAIGQDPQQYHQSGDRLRTQADGLDADQFLSHVRDLEQTSGEGFWAALKQASSAERFKYSRLFAIGLYSFLEIIDSELVNDDDRRNQTLKAICDSIGIASDKAQKDLDLYRSNLEKMSQAQIVMADMIAADRKKREDREQAKQTPETPPSTPQESTSNGN
jgi:photosystem II biogenesis protein Psp29